MHRVKDFLKKRGWVRCGLNVPRKTPLPSRELEICTRLQQARKALKVSRVAFAETTGIDSSRLSTYEHGRAPLRYGDAKRICSTFGVGLAWLATGEGDPTSVSELEDPLNGSADRMLFSDVFDDHLQPLLAPSREKAVALLRSTISRLKEVSQLLKLTEEMTLPRDAVAAVVDLENILTVVLRGVAYQKAMRARMKKTLDAIHPAKRAQRAAARIDR